MHPTMTGQLTTGTHHSNPESATPVLSLRNGAFTDQLILSIILEYFSGENGSTASCTHPLFDIVTVKKKKKRKEKKWPSEHQ